MAHQQPPYQERQGQEQTHYQVLQLEPTATLQEIKKAYRTLALQTHPDRNPPERKDESTAQFRLVNEAYEVLSDPEQRRQYDRELQQPRPSTGGGTAYWGNTGGGGGSTYPQQHGRRRRRRSHRDPFAQFNDLFQNDPFFQEAFRGMEDQFAKTFTMQNNNNNNNNNHNIPQQQAPKKSWGRWIADCLGIDFQITTSTTSVGLDGKPRISKTSTQYGGGSSNNRQQHQRTYTSKSTRTVVENGQRVTIQSMEQDGNKIEEKYINNQMVQRLINGIPEQQYHQLDGDL